MMREVFILGTSHKLQCGAAECGAAECGADKISLLEKEIRRVVSKYGIRRIAEKCPMTGFEKEPGDGAPGELALPCSVI